MNAPQLVSRVVLRASVFAMASIVAFGVAMAGEPAPAKPNLIFLLVDDLGWTDLGYCGSDLYQTPHVDRLSAAGMRFTNGYAACTVCSPTRAAAMTGMYPARLHVTDFIPGHPRPHAKLKLPDWTMRLEHRYVTLAEALRAGGYTTAQVGKWHLAPRDPEKRFVEDEDYFAIKQGFDVQVAGTCHPGTYFYPYKKGGYDARVADGAEAGQYLTDRLTDEALAIIEQNRDRPFFLYFAYFNVHTPVEGRADYVEQYAARVKPGMRHTNPAYAAMVRSVDDSVGRILAKLDELGIAERTAIVFTGDNGGLDRDGNPTENKPLRDGKGSTYEGGVREPTIVKWPGVTRPGSASDEPVITIDYYPTLLEIAGAEGDPEHNAKVDGLSLVPLLKDPQAKLARKAVYWHYPHYHSCGATPYGAVRAGDWKLIEFYEDMRVELYNLRDDIGESKDLAERAPEKRDQLRRMLHAWRDEVGAQMPAPNPQHDPAEDAKGRFRKPAPPH